MNRAAASHLAKAEDYLTKGDQFYRKAGAEIVAAMEADSTLTQRQVGERFGKSQTWVNELVRWHTSDRDTDTPWAGPRGETREASTARKVLASPTGRKRVFDELPAEARAEAASELLSNPQTQQAIAANKTTRAAVSRSTGQIYDRIEERERARHREQFPDSSNAREVVTVTTRLNNAYTAVERSIHELQDLVLAEHETAVVLAAAERLDAAADILVGFLRSGGEGFDQAINDLLREEA